VISILSPTTYSRHIDINCCAYTQKDSNRTHIADRQYICLDNHKYLRTHTDTATDALEVYTPQRSPVCYPPSIV